MKKLLHVFIGLVAAAALAAGSAAAMEDLLKNGLPKQSA